MTGDNIRNLIVASLEEEFPDDWKYIKLAEGLEEAYIGVAETFGSPPRACYDYNKCIEIFARPSDMTYDDAVEYFNVNTAGSYVGPTTPIFIKQFQL